MQGLQIKVNSYNYWLFSIFSTIFISWTISGIIGGVPGLRGVFAILMEVIVVALFFCCQRKKMHRMLVNAFVWYVVAMVCTYGFELIMGVENEILSGFSFVFPLAFFFIGGLYSQVDSSTVSLKVFLFDVICKILVTLYFYQFNDTLMKATTDKGYATADGIERMVIEYAFMYFMPVLMICILSIIVNLRRHYLVKVCWVLMFLLLAITIVLSQVSMIIAIVLLLLLVYWFYNRTGKVFRMVIPIALIVFVIYMNLETILTFVLERDWFGEAVELRISGVLKIFEMGDAYIDSTFTGNMREGDSVVNRVMAYRMSWKALADNFFTGYAKMEYTETGGHMVWIDHIARYSIFVAIPLYICIYKCYRWLRSVYSNMAKEIDVVMLYIVVIGMLNNISLTIVFLALLVVVPMFARYKLKYMDDLRGDLKDESALDYKHMYRGSWKTILRKK